MMKTLQIDILVRIEKSNLNAQITEGNITTLKKFKDVDGKEYVYISATSVKYWLKERMKELIKEVWDNIENAPKISSPEKGDVLYTPAKPITYVDADLFGYLDAENNKKRYAPIKFSGLISLYPYSGDIDFGVRYDPKGTEHTLHHIEITSNIFRGTWMILLDWIGRFVPGTVGMSEEEIKKATKKIKEIKEAIEKESEIDRLRKLLEEKIKEIKEATKKEYLEKLKEYIEEYIKFVNLNKKELNVGIDKIEVVELDINERRRRLKLFLKALFTMHHFTKQTNLLTDTQPRFGIITITKVAKPIIFDRLSATIENRDGRKIITFTKEQAEAIKNALIQHKDIIEKIIIIYDPATIDIKPIQDEINGSNLQLQPQFITIGDFLNEDNLNNFVKEVIKE